jgi:hypothetical protein
MLRSLRSLSHYKIRATDGDIGSVHSLFFDDATWNVRYLVVETGTWLSGRTVLIAPIAVGKPDWHTRELLVRLSKDQVRNSPDIDTAKPVSRIQQIRLHDYYQWPSEALAWGLNPLPMVPPPPISKEEEEQIEMLDRESDPHLRDARVLTTYDIESAGENFGQLEDFVIDDDHWVIQFLTANTGIVFPVHSIEAISWEERRIRVR